MGHSVSNHIKLPGCHLRFSKKKTDVGVPLYIIMNICELFLTKYGYFLKYHPLNKGGMSVTFSVRGNFVYFYVNKTLYLPN